MELSWCLSAPGGIDGPATLAAIKPTSPQKLDAISPVLIPGGVPGEHIIGKWQIIGHAGGNVSLGPWQRNPRHAPMSPLLEARMLYEIRQRVRAEVAWEGYSLTVAGEDPRPDMYQLYRRFRLADAGVLRRYKDHVASNAGIDTLVNFLKKRGGFPEITIELGGGSLVFLPDSWTIRVPIEIGLVQDWDFLLLQKVEHAEQFWQATRYAATQASSFEELRDVMPHISERILENAWRGRTDDPLREDDPIYPAARALYETGGIDAYAALVHKVKEVMNQTGVAYMNLTAEAGTFALQQAYYELGPLQTWPERITVMPRARRRVTVESTLHGPVLRQPGVPVPDRDADTIQRSIGHDWLRLTIYAAVANELETTIADIRYALDTMRVAPNTLRVTPVSDHPVEILVDLRLSDSTTGRPKKISSAVAQRIVDDPRFPNFATLAVPKSGLDPILDSGKVEWRSRTGFKTFRDLAVEGLFRRTPAEGSQRSFPVRRPRVHDGPEARLAVTGEDVIVPITRRWIMMQTPNNGVWVRPSVLPAGVTIPLDLNGPPRKPGEITFGVPDSDGRGRLFTPAHVIEVGMSIIRHHLGHDTPLSGPDATVDIVLHNPVNAPAPPLRLDTVNRRTVRSYPSMPAPAESSVPGLSTPAGPLVGVADSAARPHVDNDLQVYLARTDDNQMYPASPSELQRPEPPLPLAPAGPATTSPGSLLAPPVGSAGQSAAAAAAAGSAAAGVAGAGGVDVLVGRFGDRYRQLAAATPGLGWVGAARLEVMSAEFAALVRSAAVGDHVDQVLGSDHIGHSLKDIQTGLDRVATDGALAFLIADALWATSLVPDRAPVPSGTLALRPLSLARLAVLLDFVGAALAAGVDPMATPELSAIGYDAFKPMAVRWSSLALLNLDPAVAHLVRNDDLFSAFLASPALVDALFATSAGFTTPLTAAEPVAGAWHPVFGQLPTIAAQLVLARRLADNVAAALDGLAPGGPGSRPDWARGQLRQVRDELDRIDAVARALLGSRQTGQAWRARLAELSRDWVRALNDLAMLAGVAVRPVDHSPTGTSQRWPHLDTSTAVWQEEPAFLDLAGRLLAMPMAPRAVAIEPYYGDDVTRSWLWELASQEGVFVAYTPGGVLFVAAVDEDAQRAFIVRGTTTDRVPLAFIGDYLAAREVTHANLPGRGSRAGRPQATASLIRLVARFRSGDPDADLTVGERAVLVERLLARPSFLEQQLAAVTLLELSDDDELKALFASGRVLELLDAAGILPNSPAGRRLSALFAGRFEVGEAAVRRGVLRTHGEGSLRFEPLRLAALLATTAGEAGGRAVAAAIQALPPRPRAVATRWLRAHRTLLATPWVAADQTATPADLVAVETALDVLARNEAIQWPRLDEVGPLLVAPSAARKDVLRRALEPPRPRASGARSDGNPAPINPAPIDRARLEADLRRAFRADLSRMTAKYVTGKDAKAHADENNLFSIPYRESIAHLAAARIDRVFGRLAPAPRLIAGVTLRDAFTWRRAQYENADPEVRRSFAARFLRNFAFWKGEVSGVLNAHGASPTDAAVDHMITQLVGAVGNPNKPAVQSVLDVFYGWPGAFEHGVVWIQRFRSGRGVYADVEMVYRSTEPGDEHEIFHATEHGRYRQYRNSLGAAANNTLMEGVVCLFNRMIWAADDGHPSQQEAEIVAGPLGLGSYVPPNVRPRIADYKSIREARRLAELAGGPFHLYLAFRFGWIELITGPRILAALGSPRQPFAPAQLAAVIERLGNAPTTSVGACWSTCMSIPPCPMRKSSSSWAARARTASPYSPVRRCRGRVAWFPRPPPPTSRPRRREATLTPRSSASRPRRCEVTLTPRTSTRAALIRSGVVCPVSVPGRLGGPIARGSETLISACIWPAPMTTRCIRLGQANRRQRRVMFSLVRRLPSPATRVRRRWSPIRLMWTLVRARFGGGCSRAIPMRWLPCGTWCCRTTIFCLLWMSSLRWSGRTSWPTGFRRCSTPTTSGTPSRRSPGPSTLPRTCEIRSPGWSTMRCLPPRPPRRASPGSLPCSTTSRRSWPRVVIPWRRLRSWRPVTTGPRGWRGRRPGLCRRWTGTASGTRLRRCPGSGWASSLIGYGPTASGSGPKTTSSTCTWARRWRYLHCRHHSWTPMAHRCGSSRMGGHRVHVPSCSPRPAMLT